MAPDDDPDELFFSQQEFNYLFVEVHAEDRQVAMHASGDWAVEQAQKTIAAALNGEPNDNRSLLLNAPMIELLAKIVNVRMHNYNDDRRHSALDNQPPRNWLERWLNNVEKE